MQTLIRKYALQNAVRHGGKAELGSVIGKVLAERPDLKPQVKSLIPEMKNIIAQVNKMARERQEKELETLAPELLVKAEKAKRTLPELQNVKGEVVLRFAPGPSGALHIGHSRAAVLNDEYAKMYEGKLIVRIEDTDPNRIDPEAYEFIAEDLNWLGVQRTETVIQSDRFELYYEHAARLLENGVGYVCLCEPDEWRELKLKRTPCAHRDLPPETQLDEWDKMLSNVYGVEQASLVIKTDLTHRNPALRDFVAMRIVEKTHPRTRDRYTVYPLMNFSVAIDDHLLGLTHVLRGKDHLNNTHRQRYILDYFGWEAPEYIHYGIVSLKDVMLKTSKIKEGLLAGQYSGWADVRLATLRALARRGIRPEAIRQYWLDVGTKPVDINFVWENLYALNKDIIDKRANRYFFVWAPRPLTLQGAARLDGHAPLHPDLQERGVRSTHLRCEGDDNLITVYVCNKDLKTLRRDEVVRLKDLCNIRMTAEDLAQYIGDDLAVLKAGAKIIHWVPSDSIPAKVLMPDGTTVEGLAEPALRTEQDLDAIQFERFGFVRVDRMNDELLCCFAHR